MSGTNVAIRFSRDGLLMEGGPILSDRLGDESARTARGNGGKTMSQNRIGSIGKHGDVSFSHGPIIEMLSKPTDPKVLNE